MSPAPNSIKAVTFDGVTKSYIPGRPAVYDVNMQVQAGSFFTMLGPSGSGKTTSLMMLAGFETPTSGNIEVFGQAIQSVPPHKRDIGMVFQNYALFPHMSVAENLAFPLKVRGLDKAQVHDRVQRIMKTVRLEGYGDRQPSQLSGGQQQRVALARALVFQPRLVLMDEPLGALDKHLREVMQSEIKRIARELAVTIIYVTHDQSEALTMSDMIAVFNNGCIEQMASPSELYDWPANSFVAGFIGENNSLVGTITAIKGDWATVLLNDGTYIEAQRTAVASVGDRTRVSIRPERVHLEAFLNEPTLFSRRAEVLESRFMGDVIQTRLKVADNENFIVKTRNTPGLARAGQGQQVDIGWLPADCRALDF